MEPQRDFAECRTGTAIMLARDGHDGWSGALAQGELKAMPLELEQKLQTGILGKTDG